MLAQTFSDKLIKVRETKAGALHVRVSSASSSHGRRSLLILAQVASPRTTLQPSGVLNGAPAPPQSRALPAPSIFGNIEALVQSTFNSQQPGQRNDWTEIEGCWVLRPAHGRAPEAVVHFLGGAFVGAAPQICYRLFLEALSTRNIMVVATPYATSFDNLRTADEAQYKFDRCVRVLAPEVSGLPVYGVGHSLGSIIHLLISARYAVTRAGNVLMGYNNRPAIDVIPFLSPIIAPSARVLEPLLTQIAASPVRTTVEAASEAVRGFSPGVVKQVMGLVEQLAPVYLDVAQGRQEFMPAPEETKGLVRTYYAVPRNLLLRFKSDEVDDTNGLAAMLQSSVAVGSDLDLTVRTLPGDYLRPMQQALVDLPPEVARFANTAVAASGGFVGRMANVAAQMGGPQVGMPLEELSKNMNGMASMFGGQVGGPVTDGMQSLADEIAAWMGVGAVVASGTRSLPAAAVWSAQTQNPNYGPNSYLDNGAGPTPLNGGYPNSLNQGNGASIYQSNVGIYNGNSRFSNGANSASGDPYAASTGFGTNNPNGFTNSR